MKKLLLIFIASIASAALSAQTTATNFTCNDCSGTSHTLFTELDAGKVIVLTWVMPCGSCIAGASTAATTVQHNYASSNPGIVKFYLADDLANTPCATLTGWANTNQISADAFFSDAVIKMADYGASGMPKTIVIGGINHTVFYNQSGTPVSSALKAAIDNALSTNTAGIIENNNVKMGLTIFPNPALNNAKIKYTLTKPSEVSLEVMDLLGKKIKTVSLGTQPAGNQEYLIDLESLNNGIYFTRLNAGKTSEIVEVTVTR
jgi:hypothetical protein